MPLFEFLMIHKYLILFSLKLSVNSFKAKRFTRLTKILLSILTIARFEMSPFNSSMAVEKCAWFFLCSFQFLSAMILLDKNQSQADFSSLKIICIKIVIQKLLFNGTFFFFIIYEKKKHKNEISTQFSLPHNLFDPSVTMQIMFPLDVG